jgi:uncharacterized protein (TIGR02145 family)
VSNTKGPYIHLDVAWYYNATGWYHAGNHLKATSGWPANTNGTDDFSFIALPGGTRFDGYCDNLLQTGRWWSATQKTTDDAWHRGLNYNTATFLKSYFPKIYGVSVRCVKD